MRIGLLVHPCDPEKPGGLGRSNFALAEALLQEGGEHSYVVYLKGDPKPTPFSAFSNVQVVFLGTGPLWLTGGRLLDPSLDAYVFFGPIIPLGFSPKKSVVIIFDFAFLTIPARSVKERVSSWFLYLLQARALRLATHVLAISEATRQEALRYFKLAPLKVSVMHVAYMALSSEAKPLAVPDRYFLFAGVLKERKNVANIIRAFALVHAEHPDAALVIAGKPEGEYYRSLVALVQELRVGSAVHFAGYVTDAELAYLYQKAIALVFPSLLEGFGMPVLEAMHAGLPVVTSNTGALAEVAGDAALLADPQSPKAIAEGMSSLLANGNLRESLRTKGYARAAEFSWEASARMLRATLSRI
jgi:glycosyltransferase involved in cell wall biosynthesis